MSMFGSNFGTDTEVTSWVSVSVWGPNSGFESRSRSLIHVRVLECGSGSKSVCAGLVQDQRQGPSPS
uniref:Uncharacterized protein n=1 Tax=Cannabis sativa TaxID=3483 RepID=A0A803QSH2_CANSA